MLKTMSDFQISNEESKLIPILTTVIKNSGIIRFIRPKAKNPLSINTLLVLKKAFEQFEMLSKIEKIIISGSGNTFASGANLNEVAGLDEKKAIEFGRRGQSLMQTIYHSKKQTIAVIDGFCMGGGLDLTLSCKLRIASTRSVFAHPGVKLGIITGWSGTQILPRLIGKKKTLEMFLTAKKVNAKEALEIGLIDAINDKPFEELIQRLEV